MKFFLLFWALSLGSTTLAQDWNYYTPIQAKGPVPSDFTDVYLSKYQKGIENISREEGRRTRKRKDDFYRKSEYFINEYLVSGKVFFGDTITNYCQAVLDGLIGDDQVLKQQIRVYTVKSPVVNAVATANGIIFVNLGLLAQLETEAQLAYILSHELTHFTQNHVLDQYIEREKILNNESVYRRTSDDEKMSALSTYSKSQELEADRKGYEQYFSRLSYNKEAPYETMDILQYAELPFDEFAFPKDFFDTKHLKFPEEYHLGETALITASDDYDDENSSHPNLENRRQALSSVVSGNSGGVNFIISEKTFFHCRQLARFELSRLHLLERNYPLAIYNSFLLLRQDSTNRYLRLTIAKALQSMMVYHNARDLYEVVDDHEGIEGSAQELYYFFDAISRDELATLAVSYSYELKKDFPGDSAVARVFDKCLTELVMENGLISSDFISPTQNLEDKNTEPDPAYRENTKIGRIRKKAGNDSTSSKTDFHLYAFLDFLKDPDFVKAFREKEELKANSAYWSREKRYDKRSKYDNNVALGVRRVLCVTPQYLKLDQRDEDGIKFISTDERLARYRQYLKEIAGMVNLELIMLDYKDGSKLTTRQFNDIALISSWLQERLSHVNNKVLNSDFDYVQDIIDRYNTPYFINTGNVSLKVDESFAGPILASIILPPILPFAILDLVTQDYESFNYFFAFDLRNGDALLADYNYYQSSDARDYIRSVLYNSLLQISDEPKNRKP
ncbi:MAG: M48 family metallopeptidase [Owenweeksia sp.]